MRANPYGIPESSAVFDRFLESEVLSADSLSLVNMLYRGAAEAIAAARRQLAAGDVKARSESIVRAHAIVHELSTALDLSAGELAANLRELYDYIQRRLVEANTLQQDAPLAECESLIRTVLEAWQQIAAAPAAAAPRESYVPVCLAG